MRQIKRRLKKYLKGARRIAVLGIGSDLSGDDAIGVLVACALNKKFKTRRSSFKVFLGGNAPENITGPIKRFNPTHLIMVDAADIKQKAGGAALIDLKKISGVTFSTHRLPTKILADYLIRSIGCAIIVIGVQPKTIGFGEPLSCEAKKSSAALAKVIAEVTCQVRD